eukprot:jgi/Ulvmu1/11634/UM008_0038.1
MRRRRTAMHVGRLLASLLLCTASIRGQGLCQWHEHGQLALCVATTDDPAGLRFAQWQLDLQRCIRFSDANTTVGCITDLPECATRVLTAAGDGAEQRVCFPANATISTTDEQSSLVALGNCSGVASPTCDQVRQEAYPLLGCSGCADPASAAVDLVPLCAAAQASEAACHAADGTADVPGPAPAPAPATADSRADSPTAPPLGVAPKPGEPETGAGSGDPPARGWTGAPTQDTEASSVALENDATRSTVWSVLGVLGAVLSCSAALWM